MTTLLETTRRAIRAYNLLDAGDTVVVAVSGGPDSVALLDVLTQLAPELGLTLHVGHLDHSLRPDSAEDAAFVADLAARLGVAATVERVDVRALAEAHGRSLEEAARLARYDFLGRLAQRIGAAKVATAHHAEDQAETLLLRLVRGAGTAGLAGMRLVAPLPGPTTDDQRPTTDDGDVSMDDGSLSVVRRPSSVIIRPFLRISRAEIMRHIEARGLAYRLDPTNDDLTITRNRVRHELLPHLAAYNPAIVAALGRTSAVLADDQDALVWLAEILWPTVARPVEGGFELDLAGLRALPGGVQRRLVRLAVERLRGLRDLRAEHVERALTLINSVQAEPGEQASLPNGVTLSRGYTTLFIGLGAPPLPDLPLLPPDAAPVSVAVPGVTAVPETRWSIHVEAMTKGEGREGKRGGSEKSLADTLSIPKSSDSWSVIIDARVAEGGLWLRGRRRGERFQPLGLDGHSRSLHDFMNGVKAPRDTRDRLALLVNQEHVVWVSGFRLDHRARVTEGTERVLRVRFTQELPAAMEGRQPLHGHDG